MDSFEKAKIKELSFTLKNFRNALIQKDDITPKDLKVFMKHVSDAISPYPFLHTYRKDTDTTSSKEEGGVLLSEICALCDLKVKLHLI